MAASASSWEHDPFTEGKSIPYKAVWNDEQFARISMGLIPREMEDKWFIFYETPHVFFHRSWTGQPVYKLTVAQGDKGYEVTEALSSINLYREARTDSIYQAQLLDFLVSNLLLGESKPFPSPPSVGKQMEPDLTSMQFPAPAIRINRTIQGNLGGGFGSLFRNLPCSA